MKSEGNRVGPTAMGMDAVFHFVERFLGQYEATGGPMQFFLIDRITAMDTESATAQKAVSLAEEYLREHFRTSPVLPGVLELEGLTQLAGWWIRHIRGFDGAEIVSLRTLQNVKYGRFVRPGETVQYRIQLRGCEENIYAFDALAEIVETTAGGETMPRTESAGTSERVVSARMTVTAHSPTDSEVTANMRQRLAVFFKSVLWRGENIPA